MPDAVADLPYRHLPSMAPEIPEGHEEVPGLVHSDLGSEPSSKHWMNASISVSVIITPIPEDHR